MFGSYWRKSKYGQRASRDLIQNGVTGSIARADVNVFLVKL
jgi:hypothetical protein